MIELPPQLSLQHKEGLLWFEENKNLDVSWPKPVNGFYIVNRAKGIHKPKGIKYAISVRQTFQNNYSDKSMGFQSDGSWTYQYHQEGADKEYFTNAALIKCMEDGIPVGVMIQSVGKPAIKYKIFGLGEVYDFRGGYFYIRERIRSSQQSLVKTLEFNSKTASEDDDRNYGYRAIAMRSGQPAFRSELLEAYEGKCAITGCKALEALEAAHILPYKGHLTNHVQNGLLLRADIHVLFDLHLLEITPVDMTVKVHPKLLDTEYKNLEGRKIYLPKNQNHRPSPEALILRLDGKKSN